MILAPGREGLSADPQSGNGCSSRYNERETSPKFLRLLPVQVPLHRSGEGKLDKAY